MAPRPRVSVITPCYNAGRFIDATVDSLLLQSFPDWEHVIVDDGSTDGAVETLHMRLASDSRFRFISQPNGGAARARNMGYRSTHPETDYLLFLDADDCLEPHALETWVAYLDQHPAVGIAYARCSFIDASGADIADPPGFDQWQQRRICHGWKLTTIPPTDPVTPFESIFLLASLIPSNSAIRRSAYARTSGWDPGLGQPVEDTDLFLRIALRSEVHFLCRNLVRYRVHSTQSTTDRAHLVSQYKKLYAKWSRLGSDDPLTARTIDHAIMIREGFALPRMWTTWGSDHLRSGRAVAAMKCYLRAAKYGGGYWLGRAARSARFAVSGPPAPHPDRL